MCLFICWYIVFIYIKIKVEASRGAGAKSVPVIDWLWVRSPLEEMKYLFTVIFSFHRSGVEGKAWH